MKQPARIITAVWGETYLDNFLTATLPALIAPGNLPTLAQSFDCELVVVTETRFFEKVSHALVLLKIEDVCRARLVSLDDLVMTRLHYGMTSTYAYMRGFEDLGERSTEWYLIFLNSDFILADGSYRTLTQRLLAGERLVVAPSYCVIEERIKPLVKYVLRHPITHALAIPPRQLAALAIPNRHLTIRGKTVNQQMYSMDHIEQFYWYVDEHTILAHQLPIAVVCMKPERVVASLETFWDYGLVSELCPTVKPCVLQDSDDFLMIELRGADTYAEKLALGWPSVDEIAADLSTFTTKDHRDYGQHSLLLHSEDIPASVSSAKASLRAFVDSVYERMSPEPRDYRNHPYWVASCKEFQRAKALYQAPKAKKHSPTYLQEVSIAGAVGRSPGVGRWHLFWDDVRHANRILETAFDGKICKVLHITASTEGRARLLFMEPATGSSCVLVEEFYANNDLLDRAIDPQVKFDFCIVEVNFDNLRHFPRLFSAVRPYLRRGGKVVAVYLNTYGRRIYKNDSLMMKAYFPSTDSGRVHFSGTALGVMSRRLFTLSEALAGQSGFRRLVATMLMLLSWVFAFVANCSRRKMDSQHFTEQLTSLTIEMDVI